MQEREVDRRERERQKEKETRETEKIKYPMSYILESKRARALKGYRARGLKS